MIGGEDVVRILHFSDLHIGVENYGRVDPATGLSTRLTDFLHSLDQVVEYALSEGVDLVILAGDAYKGRDPSQTHQREFAVRLSKLTGAGIPCFLLVGNHDLPSVVSRANAVEIFRTLQVPHLTVGDSLQTYLVRTKSGPLQVLAVPWPRRSGILTREESRGLSILEVRNAIETRMTEAIERRVAELDPDVPAVLAGHLSVSGATNSSERSMMLGQDHVLLAGSLAKPQLDYVALGHIHKHQVLRWDRPLMAYSGSLQRVDFSEENDDKGFCVVDLDPAGAQGARLKDFSFHPLQARRFLTLDVAVRAGEGDLTNPIDPTEAVLREIARKDITDSVVRLRIEASREADAHLREAEIRQALRPAHYIAAISREITGDVRRTRLSADAANSLEPMQALRLFLESRGTEQRRLEKIMARAEELLSEEDLA